MTSAAACFHEGSAQLGARNKSNIRFNAMGSGETIKHFWPKIAGGCLHETLKPYTLQIGQVEGCFAAFGFLIENNFLDALTSLDFNLSVGD